MNVYVQSLDCLFCLGPSSLDLANLRKPSTYRPATTKGMEKYSQFRDRGSGIAPFIPVKTPRSRLAFFTHLTIFLLRLPMFLTVGLVYALFLHHLPLPAVVRKACLWSIMLIPGIWWVDLQLDGVRRGTLAEQPRNRVPHPGSVIAATLTSPIDALYLAAIFDPIFTRSYPSTRQVESLSLFGAVAATLAPVRLHPSPRATLVDLDALVARHPDRVVVVFPEASPTNGKAVLPFAPSLLGAAHDTPIFPVSLRYTPADVTTPIPGRWTSFLWDLLSRPSTCVRVRIAESTYNTSRGGAKTASSSARESQAGEQRYRMGGDDDGSSASKDSDFAVVTPEEQRVLDKIADDLARLGRNKRVGLTLKDKAAFMEAWNGRK
ncbi:hypothetical protein ACRALDRAFT_1069636 [Sodiomyces alcalophilus JCM 7366]|uniref:uncharacterized protein n=1 Tax=Sodiomyces alcalophilus JCM 7366 TaxID=591952 RepID=UPI0039B3B5A1